MGVLARDLDRLAVPAFAVIGAGYGVLGLLGGAPLPGDAKFYWRPEYLPAHYVYPPPLAQLLEPLRVIDAVPVFVVAWMALCFGSFGYVLGRWAFLALAFLPVDVSAGGTALGGPMQAVLHGNVTMPMVAAMVAGMRRPGWWAVPLLTKMTVGVGVLWYAFRGEWRAFATALGVTAAIVGLSVLVGPDDWRAFAGLVAGNMDATSNGPAIVGPPLWLRLPVAVGVVAVAARTDRAWMVPLACALAITGLYGLATWAGVACAALSPRLSRGCSPRRARWILPLPAPRPRG